jgi:hypothetical protein
MLKQTIALLALTTSIGLPATLTLAPQPAQAICAAPTTLTGVWYANDGGTYHVRQTGNIVTWRGASKDNGKTWNHIFRGTRTGNIITGTWADQPSGKIHSKGMLKLKVNLSANGQSIHDFTRLQATGGFGGSRWYKTCNDVQYNGVSE